MIVAFLKKTAVSTFGMSVSELRGVSAGESVVYEDRALLE